ncbi:MAG: M48 family metalloprotease [Leptolyngbyaceae bacterium]|nr:M48 family metalloprotease [Leptolyngbyaceae bacterium]
MNLPRKLCRIAYRRVLPLSLALLSTIFSIWINPLIQPSFATLPIPQPSPALTLKTKPKGVLSAPPQATVQPSPESAQIPPQAPTPTDSSNPAPIAEQPTEPTLTPEEVSRQIKLIEADQLYLGGQFAAAEKLYREVKTPLGNQAISSASSVLPEPFSDSALLSPAGRVYWRESEAGLAAKLETRTLVPLKLLVQQVPQFVPGQIRLAQMLREYGRLSEAVNLMESATSLYPNQPDLLKAKVTTLEAANQWMEASISARQFALLNPGDPAAAEFDQIADRNLQRFQGALQERLTGNAIANFLTGALSFALTGSLYGPFSAVQTATMLLQGESGLGESVAKQAKEQLEMVEDPEIQNYVTELGQRIATVAGRKDFKYEFYVVLDDKLNAFALPGGKVFVNAGALVNTHSEAELAGLMAHEISHAVLSHGFQLVAEGNLLSNATQFLPLSGLLTNLFVFSYSRDMERQADFLGTRILASTGYAADGMRNLMVALKKEETRFPFSFLSTHPVTDERISYLENLIDRNGYNRYAYEGVAKHAAIKTQVKKLLAEQKARDTKPDKQP